MAKPIKETPYLSGSDAKKFIEDNKNVITISDIDKDSIKKSYEAFKSIADFDI